MSAGATNVHFREHDIEFLQTRTKLWLETVLGETYGDRTLPELISDGNLLFRLSKYVNKEVTGASPGPQELSPSMLDRLNSKNSGKYLPYANVDAFLKTCKKVGLTDVELFSPSDAVEGKDIRRVCTSIRSLAKKARALHMRVPDFEDVNRPLPMPKEKVEEIKENLQHSHSSPVKPTVVAPEEDIKMSERVQIVSRFLSSTTNPLSGPPSDPPSPSTPGPSKPLSCENPRLSTPIAAIGGIDTLRLTKSVSNIGPSPVRVETSKDSLLSSPQSIALGEPKLNETATTPSPALLVDEPSDFPLFSRKALGSFRHGKPHFSIKSSSRSTAADLSEDPPVAVTAGHPEPEKPHTLQAVSTPSKPIDPNLSTPLPPVELKLPKAAVSKPSMPVDSKPAVITLSTSVDSKLSKSATPSTRRDSKFSTPDISSDQQADRSKELPTLAQLGLGAYRHAHPHFSFKQSSQVDSTDSQDLQLGANTVRASNGKLKAPSSNKIVETDPRSTTQQIAEVPGRARFGSGPESSQGSSAPAKESAGKPQAKAPGVDLSPRLWIPLVAGALAFVGTLLVVRPRESIFSVYEVKEGDTLSAISKRVGKKSWDELVQLNPGILNPDLIYPSERLKLPPK